MITLIKKIYAWLHGECFISAFIDEVIFKRLEYVYKMCKEFTSYRFANRREFYIYLIGIGLDVIEKICEDNKDNGVVAPEAQDIA